MQLASGLIWERTPARAIRAWADQRNAASVALLHRCGMIHLGTQETNIIEEAFILHRPKAR